MHTHPTKALIVCTVAAAFCASSLLPTCEASEEEPCWDTRDGTRRCHCRGDADCQALAEDTNCSALPRCSSILGKGIISGCGWCWDSSTTRGQIHGGRHGTLLGPSDGHCSDWTYWSFECHNHVDCPGDVNTCTGIMGTYCGWCIGGMGGTGTAFKGTTSGPSNSSVKCDTWVWDHSKCTRPQATPEQIRWSFSGNAGELYAVTWATALPVHNSSLRFLVENKEKAWSTSKAKRVTVPAITTVFTMTNGEGFQHIHRAVFDPSGIPLGSSLTYDVQVCANASGPCEARGPFTFAVRRDPVQQNSTTSPTSVLLYGDMGRHGGGQILGALKRELAGHGPTTGSDAIDAFVHIGDFAYDLPSSDGLNGDTFFQRIEPLATARPYQSCPGNHEIQASGENATGAYFAHYRNRFTMPRGMGSKASDSSNPAGLDMWHSWNLGPVHFISYSSEVFFSADATVQQRMIKWLEQDLAQANQARDAQPWIVTFGHRPMYCSNVDGDDCTKVESVTRKGLEELFHRGGVDLAFSAHEHSYERMFPVYDYGEVQIYDQSCRNDDGCAGQTVYEEPRSMVHIVTGAAGCNEDAGTCINPILKSRGNWSAFYLQAPGTYSYGRLTAHNSTVLQWEVVLAEEERVVDDVIVHSSRHGPRITSTVEP